MIFKIADGREYFYQWDIDRQIIVSDPTIKEVHFCNRTDDCSLVVEVVDGVANVPNIILQKSFDVRVFGYDGKATLHEATFKVKARTQPADYVYTETVVKSIDEILEAAETVTTTANEFYEFVEHHTLDLADDGEGNVELVAVDCEGENVDLTDYYTKAEVNELIENIDIPEVPETDLTGYATEAYVDKAIAEAQLSGSDVDLSDYALKTDIPDVSDFISEIPGEYITETELNAKGYLTEHQSLAGYATEKYVDEAIANINIPGGAGGSGTPLYQHTVYIGANGKVEGVRDPSAYTTFVCDRAEEFTFESFVDYLNTTGATLAISGTIFVGTTTPVYPLDILKVNDSGTGLIVSYRSSTDGSTPQFLTWTITSTEVTNFTDTVSLIGTASSGSGNADLSNYYTKEETEALIPDVSEFISEIPAEYVTETELEAKGYATGGYVDGKIAGIIIPSLDGYATESYVNEAIAGIEIPEGGESVDLTDYYTKDETDEQISILETNMNDWLAMEFYTKSEVDELVANAGGGSSEGGGSTEGAVSYEVEQSLTNEQKNTAKANMGLPYVVSEQYNICTNKSNTLGKYEQTVSVSIGIDGAATLSSLPVGTKFKITVADAETNPTFTETVECELTSSTSFKYLTDVSNYQFFHSWTTTGSISSYAISFYKRDTSNFSGLFYFTVIAGEFEAANKLDSRLVDLSGYITREEFASIKTAEGGAY